jgi:hypothetical protein
MLLGSPFGVTGRCYSLAGGLVVTQWLGASEGLSIGNNVMLASDKPLEDLLFPPGIYMGVGPFTYMTTMGEQRTIPSLRYTGLPPIPQ